MTLHSRADARTDLLHGTLDMLDSPDPPVGAAARLRHRPDDPRAVVRRPAGRDRVALSGPAAARQEGLGDGEVGPDRGQPAREVLPAHARGQEAARSARNRGGRELVNAIGRVMTPAAAPGQRGVAMSILSWLTAAARRSRRRRLPGRDPRASGDRRPTSGVADGADPARAHYAALKEFGNVTLTTEAARRVWTPRWLEAAARSDERRPLRGPRRSRRTRPSRSP